MENPWKSLTMTNIPVRNSSGGLNCPRCGTSLVKGLAPFILHGEYVGRFESIECKICNYSALTANGYDRAMSAAKSLALVGTAEGEEELGFRTSEPMYIGVRAGNVELLAEKV